MKVIKTKLDGVLVVHPRVFGDDRGSFLETWSKERYVEAGISEFFVQDNVSFSHKGVLRGLHYQHPNGQGKLVQVLSGTVLDVAVDIRIGSPSFGEWFSCELSGENHKQMYIQPGFAHGFCVKSDTAIFSYKCTNYYDQSSEGGVIWNDPDIGIGWGADEPILSEKDLVYSKLEDISEERLPHFQG